jgi:hypothetical protein
MTSNLPDPNVELKFLCLNYSGGDFLINSEQVHSSLFMEREYRIKSPFPFLSTVIRYGEKIVLLFDFHNYLKTVFQCGEGGSARLIVILRVDGLSEVAQYAFNRIRVVRGQDMISDKYLAMKIPSVSQIVPLKIRNLKPVPFRLRNLQNREGVLGLRFPGEGRIQFFVDSEIFFANQVIRKRGMHADTDR